METRANPNPNGCLARAMPDEPMFILLGRDLEAPKSDPAMDAPQDRGRPASR
jgi:hypothetical protein